MSEDLGKLVTEAVIFCGAIGADPNPARLQRIIQAVTGSEPPKQKRARKAPPSSEDLRAWAILDAVWTEFKALGVAPPMTVARWRSVNRRAADGIDPGIAPEEVASRIRLANTNGRAPWLRGRYMLQPYLEAWSKLDPKKAEESTKMRLEPGQTVHFTSWGQPIISNSNDPEAIDTL